MHYFLIRHPKYWGTLLSTNVNNNAITKVAPSAKVYDERLDESHFVIEYAKLLDAESKYQLVEVDGDDAEKLMISKKVLSSGGYYDPELIYVFKDIKRETLDADAIVIKLGDNLKYVEDADLQQSAVVMNSFGRKINKFMKEVQHAKPLLSKELADTFEQAHDKFKVELTEFRNERRKAKIIATKQMRSFKAKLLKFAIYKR